MRYRALSALGVAAVVAVGLIVGFAGTGGSYAAWNSGAKVNGTTISTGSTTIAVSNAAQTTPASTLALGALTSNMGPGDVVASAFVVSNTGTTPVTLAANLAASGTPTALTNALHAAVVSVSSAGACTTSLSSSATGALAGYSAASLGHVASGATQNLCLLVVLPATAPSSAQGLSAPFTLTVTGTQASS
ncbi:hypothetical protein ACFOYW_08040 [Gryllotalpicola reticulitermitis]|uniref:SipW-cognate class signal peptide n=1 Tax=Gryllotalpicola reticulitermitis TaxID=1184153 RepID=A0ABV8Q775_9MICO